MYKLQYSSILSVCSVVLTCMLCCFNLYPSVASKFGLLPSFHLYSSSLLHLLSVIRFNCMIPLSVKSYGHMSCFTKLSKVISGLHLMLGESLWLTSFLWIILLSQIIAQYPQHNIIQPEKRIKNVSVGNSAFMFYLER